MVDKSKFAAEDALGLGYKVHIAGRNLMVTEAMKNYVFDKLSKIEKFHNHVIDAHVALEAHRVEYTAAISLKLDHLYVKVSATSTDLYVSIDEMVKRLEEKVKRWKGRVQDYHKQRKSLTDVDIVVNVLKRPFSEVDEINAEIDAEARRRSEKEFSIPKVIGNEKKPLKTLRQEEAVMKMELSDDRFMVYRDEADRKLKVIYRREDGNYGIILPE